MMWLLFLAAFPNPNTGNASNPAKTINPVTYGADPTCTRDSSTAINRAITSMSPSNFNSQGYILSFPPGCYKLSAPIDVVRRIIMTCSTTITNGTPPCALMPDVGVTAIIVHYASDGSADGGQGADTQINNMAIIGTQAPAWTAAHATTLNSFVRPDEYSHYVMKATSVSSDTHTGGTEPAWSTTDYTGSGSPVGTTIADNHVTWTYNFSPGIYCRARCHLSYVTIQSIAGDAMAVVADTLNSPATNANGSSVDHALIQDANGNGLYLRGGDSNAGHFSDIDGEGSIYGWCVYDYSFLGNKHTTHQCASSVGLGAYYLRSANASGNSLDDAYSEGGITSKVMLPAQAIGGFAAQFPTSDSTGLIITGTTVKTDLIFGDTVDGTTLQLGGTTPAGGQGVAAYGSPSHTSYTHYNYAGAGTWWSLNVDNLGDKIYTPYRWTDVNSTWGTAQFWAPNGIDVGWASNSSPGSKLYSDTAAPGSGIYQQGDITFNRMPTAGTPIGWRCIASSGSPASCSNWETLAASGGSGESMLSSTVIDLSLSTKQTLYTVPGGQHLIVTKIIGRTPSASITTADGTTGYNASADDVGTSIMPATTNTYSVAIPSISRIGAATDILGFKTTATQAATTMTVDVFGYSY